MLRHPTTFSNSVLAAKQLVGQFPNLRADQPVMFIASVAAVLQQYPWDVVRECVDPRYGVARKVEFLTLRALVDWMDLRVKLYTAIASNKPRQAIVHMEPSEAERVSIGTMLADLVSKMREKSRAFTQDTTESLKQVVERRGWKE